MLLDRKKINRLTKWSAIILAAVFLLSFVLLGVGSSSAGNVFSGCSGSGSISASSSFEDKEQYYKDQLADNPQDTNAILALVSLYSDDSVGRYQDAIDYLYKYLELQPNDLDAKMRIASIYINKIGDNQAAIVVLNEVTAAAPDYADAFLQLGLAQKNAGQTQAAILSLNRYLELAPNSANADLVQQEIDKLMSAPATTTPEETAPAATTP